jgi:hypothetical protein
LKYCEDRLGTWQYRRTLNARQEKRASHANESNG